ncbi:MAG TPA: CbiX/SirB N-terminal domain-containing protein [Armatimonadota bacterium]|jgi:sirohydrochlorin cobaltochelatase
MKRAIIVLGHGSRSADATEQFLRIIEMLRELHPDDSVLPAFMELAPPRLAEAISLAIGQGAKEIIVLPCFLFQGMHIKRDIPEMLAELKAENPDVTVLFGRPIGPDPRIAEILTDRLEEIACPV